MPGPISGIHHLTAIAGDPQRNLDFYAGVLGLRLVKLTVNFDVPNTYHLYYGDEVGRPGTIITFFPWPHMRRGRVGAGQFTATALSIPPGALDYWRARLEAHGVQCAGPLERFEETVLAFEDPDGLPLELVAHQGAEERPGWPQGPVPAEMTIRGIYGISAVSLAHERTARVLTELLGLRELAREDGRVRYVAGQGGSGAIIDLIEPQEATPGIEGTGTVHHLALRVPDDEAQRQVHHEVAEHGFRVTPVLDRQYFRSIYFRELGGLLFEIATDPPGFTVDEPAERLGSELRLPPWLEPRREELIRQLPPLRLSATR